MLSLQERIKVVQLMAKFESVTLVRRQWNKEMNSDAPTEKTIRSIYDKFLHTRSVLDLDRSGRKPLHEGDILKIQKKFEDKPCCSVRDAEKSFQVPRETIIRTLKCTIGMKTYHVRKVHQLQADDYEV